jgi:hypothetical protein
MRRVRFEPRQLTLLFVTALLLPSSSSVGSNW